MSKKTIVLLGANGFVGSEIKKVILVNNNYDLIPVIRGDDAGEAIKHADIVIHSANPAGRYRAENNQEWDFEESVEKTSKFFEYSKNKKFILISSLSCRTQLYTNYGRHRRACELLILTNPNSLIVRLGPMFGGNRKKDMLHDILANRKVYISNETRYAYADVEWVAKKLIDIINYTGIKEIGAHNYVKLKNISKYFGSQSEFDGRIENQIPIGCVDGPDANDVYAYAEMEKNV